jgi:hypothetical protein
MRATATPIAYFFLRNTKKKSKKIPHQLHHRERETRYFTGDYFLNLGSNSKWKIWATTLPGFFSAPLPSWF